MARKPSKATVKTEVAEAYSRALAKGKFLGSVGFNDWLEDLSGAVARDFGMTVQELGDYLEDNNLIGTVQKEALKRANAERKREGLDPLVWPKPGSGDWRSAMKKASNWDPDTIDWGSTGVIDHVLQGRTLYGSETTSVRDLTDKARAAKVLRLPVEAGTRVRFAHNLGAVLAYKDFPAPGIDGTVITVRMAGEGDVTAHNGYVMVNWDDGVFRAVQPEHLRSAKTNHKRASSVRRTFTALGDITSLFEVSPKVGSSDLIYKATRDLWSFRQGENGEYVLERLFQDDGKPLKDT